MAWTPIYHAGNQGTGAGARPFCNSGVKGYNGKTAVVTPAHWRELAAENKCSKCVAFIIKRRAAKEREAK